MVDIVTRFPQYCEYISNFWLHEPLNAITNFGFFIGAYFLYRLIKKNNLNMNLGTVLISMMIALGLGSLAWHSYRITPTLLMDEIPIYIFIAFAFYFLTKSLARSHKLTIIISFFTALIYYAVFAYIPSLNVFQGAFKYIFVVLLFLILSMLIVKKFGPHYSLILPLSLLAFGVLFRIMDLYICPVFPLGTHFIWHILVVSTMYFTSIIILRLGSLQSTLD